MGLTKFLQDKLEDRVNRYAEDTQRRKEPREGTPQDRKDYEQYRRDVPSEHKSSSFIDRVVPFAARAKPRITDSVKKAGGKVVSGARSFERKAGSEEMLRFSDRWAESGFGNTLDFGMFGGAPRQKKVTEPTKTTRINMDGKIVTIREAAPKKSEDRYESFGAGFSMDGINTELPSIFSMNQPSVKPLNRSRRRRR